MMNIDNNCQSSPIVMLVRALSGGGAQRDAVEVANGLLAAGCGPATGTAEARARHEY